MSSICSWWLEHLLFFWDGSVPSWDWHSVKTSPATATYRVASIARVWEQSLWVSGKSNDRTVSMKTINHDVLIPEVFRLEIFNYSDSSLKSSIVIFIWVLDMTKVVLRGRGFAITAKNLSGPTLKWYPKTMPWGSFVQGCPRWRCWGVPCIGQSTTNRVETTLGIPWNIMLVHVHETFWRLSVDVGRLLKIDS